MSVAVKLLRLWALETKSIPSVTSPQQNSVQLFSGWHRFSRRGDYVQSVASHQILCKLQQTKVKFRTSSGQLSLRYNSTNNRRLAANSLACPKPPQLCKDQLPNSAFGLLCAEGRRRWPLKSFPKEDMGRSKQSALQREPRHCHTV
jgi:hypothetical protein